MQPFNFVYERFVDDKPYPNLVEVQDLSRDWTHLWHTWPYVIPCRLERYCHEFDYPVNNYLLTQDFPSGSFYPIGIGRWDYGCDYFSLLHNNVIDLIRMNKLRLLIYSHEGDDPTDQKKHLDLMAKRNCIPSSGYVAVSGNILAIKNVENFSFFPDHELFYYVANKDHAALQIHDRPRERDFTCLSRIHKWWRATATVHLHQTGLLDNSYWSYHNFNGTDKFENNPIQINGLPGLERKIRDFIDKAPYTCDNLSLGQINTHDTLVPEHYQNSYVNIIYETLFDVSHPFYTEKTFKPIKHGQPFVLVGAHNSLVRLRQLGYKTFSNVIDDSYDYILDPTERWLAIRNTIADIKHRGLDQVFRLCMDDVLHNQNWFLQSKAHRLITLQWSISTSHERERE